jgi:hypothetical protein
MRLHKHILILAICTICIPTLSACGSPQPAETTVEPTATKAATVTVPIETVVEPERGRIEIASVPSPSLANAVVYPVDNNDVLVYLPPGYANSEKSYPVIYALPGEGFSKFDLQNLNLLEYVLDGLWTDGTLPPMIFVFCWGGGPFDEGDPIYVTNSSFQGNVLDFCARDVVAYMDTQYRTLSTPAGRGLLGDTITGDAALRMASTYSDVFSAVYINHPWILAEGSLENGDTNFTQPLVVEKMLDIADRLMDVPPDQAGTVYQEILSDINSAGPGFTMVYAMQYMSEPTPPYFSYLFTDIDTPADPEVWNRWESGVGALQEKVTQGKEGLMQLAGLGIGRGSSDNFLPWALSGMLELHQVLNEAGIPHQWDEYKGNGYELIDRLETVIVPFFADHFVAEPGS